MRAELELNRGKERVLLDGVDVASRTRSLTIAARAGELTTLTLNLALAQGATFRGDVIIRLSAENEAILLDLGWWPPADTEGQ
jgi:hypothetical protein